MCDSSCMFEIPPQFYVNSVLHFARSCSFLNNVKPCWSLPDFDVNSVLQFPKTSHELDVSAVFRILRKSKINQQKAKHITKLRVDLKRSKEAWQKEARKERPRIKK